MSALKVEALAREFYYNGLGGNVTPLTGLAASQSTMWRPSERDALPSCVGYSPRIPQNYYPYVAVIRERLPSGDGGDGETWM
ncbi:MAG TPA: hypothetical protein VGI45_04970 [Terracidiphilus sp.]